MARDEVEKTKPKGEGVDSFCEDLLEMEKRPGPRRVWALFKMYMTGKNNFPVNVSLTCYVKHLRNHFPIGPANTHLGTEHGVESRAHLIFIDKFAAVRVGFRFEYGGAEVGIVDKTQCRVGYQELKDAEKMLGAIANNVNVNLRPPSGFGP